MIKKKFMVLLTAVMVIIMLPMIAFAAEFPDMPDNWSTAALQNAVSNGLLQGIDGKIMPDANLTRAQMATIVNRAFGATEKASLSGYTDVSAAAWYYDEMAIAVHMGTFTGNANKLNPQSIITRQESFVVLAKAFKLSRGSASALDGFKDKDSVSSWAVDAASALKDAGYLGGAGGKINPLATMTRAEFAQMMDNMIKCYFKAEGIYTSVPSGNVMVNAQGVTLKGVTVTGDLVIGDGVGDGDVTLDSVKVTGRTVIRGGGVNSIKITGISRLQNIIVTRVDGKIRIYTSDGSEVGEVSVDGKDDVIIEGNVGKVTILASDVAVTTTNARIGSIAVKGENSQIIIGTGAKVNRLTVDGSKATVEVTGSITNVVINGNGTQVRGSGSVENVKANANNVVVTTPNTTVTAAAGTTGVTAGTNTVRGGNTQNSGSGSTGGSSGGGGLSGSTIPAISSLSPVAGPASGGTTVTITGTDFTGATAVTFGGTASVSFTVDSPTQITAVTPAHTAGAARVVVTAAGKSSTNALDFTYVAAPVVTSVSLATGPAVGGTSVTITGTGFTGATAVSFGGMAATSFIVDSDTQITAVTPVHPAGAAQVVVTTAGGSSTGSIDYFYVVAPVVTSVSLATGPAVGGTSVAITGTGFTDATDVSFGGTPTVFNVDSDTQITAETPAHDAGAAQVVVTAIGGSSTDLVDFTYVAPPTVTSVSPAAGPVAGGNTVTITGTDFTGATAVSFGGSPATSFTVDFDTQITAIVPALAEGPAPVVVTIPVGGAATNWVEYTYCAVPTVTSISTGAGIMTGGTYLTVTGTGFTGTTAVTFGGIAATSFTVFSDTQITAVTPANDEGAAQVIVTAAGGMSIDLVNYTYVAPPVVSSVSPQAGTMGGGTTVTITGTGFTGAFAVRFSGTIASSFTVVSDTQIKAVTPPFAVGGANVTVYTPIGWRSNDTVIFHYVTIPVVSSLSLTQGTTLGGDTVTITCPGSTDFMGTTEVYFGAQQATSFTVVDPWHITAVTPAHPVGTAQVVVAKYDASSTEEVYFTYE